MIQVGLHLVVELYGCRKEDISTLEVYREKIERVVNEAGVTVLRFYHHQFNPHGVTSIFLLAESHLTVHTWPEYNYMAVDIFTCGSSEKAWCLLDCLREKFKPMNTKVVDIMRGIPYEEVQRISAPIPE